MFEIREGRVEREIGGRGGEGGEGGRGGGEGCPNLRGIGVCQETKKQQKAQQLEGKKGKFS